VSPDNNDTPTDRAPTRAVISALVASVRPGDSYPAWARLPACEAEFLASLLLHSQREAHLPRVTITYDAFGRAQQVRGIRPKGDNPHAGAALTGAAS
jgi:hypothetical protein